jgi:RNA methyltransferase, TrmH family
MTVQALTSKDNPLLKSIRLIAAGARRAPKQVVIAEGLRVLEEVQRSSFSVEAVVCSEAFGSAPRERELLDRFDEKRVRLFRVSDTIYQSISTVQTPQGVIALVNAPDRAFASVPESPNALILCACGLQDPGNLGTLIRTAAAANASLLCTTSGTVSARNPKSIRSSAGAFFRVPIIEHADFQEFRLYCHSRAIRLYRTDAQEGVIYTQADLASPCAILLGNEGSGLTEQTIRDLPSIRIPIAEGVESLNVATAGAILLFEARRQRGPA